MLQLHHCPGVLCFLTTCSLTTCFLFEVWTATCVGYPRGSLVRAGYVDCDMESSYFYNWQCFISFEAYYYLWILRYLFRRGQMPYFFIVMLWKKIFVYLSCDLDLLRILLGSFLVQATPFHSSFILYSCWQKNRQTNPTKKQNLFPRPHTVMPVSGQSTSGHQHHVIRTYNKCRSVAISGDFDL